MRKNKIFLVFFIVGILFSLFVTWTRFLVEKDYKDYELTMEFNLMAKTASNQNLDTESAIKFWKDVGLDSITLTENNINSLKMNNDFKVNTHLEGYDLFVNATKDGIDYIYTNLIEVLPDDRSVVRKDENTLVIKGKMSDLIYRTEYYKDYLEGSYGIYPENTISKLELVGLGYIDKDIEIIKDKGMPIQFKPVYMPEVQLAKPSVDRFIKYVQKYSHQSYVMFSGNYVLAGDDSTDYFIEQLNNNNIAIGLVEDIVQRGNIKQKGIKTLVRKSDYNAVRVFNTFNYIQKRYDYMIPMHHHGEEIINTYFRAITERNIRVILFKPFCTSDNKLISDKEVYKDRFDELDNRLSKYPHKFRQLYSDSKSIMHTMPRLSLNPFILMIIAFGVVAGFMIVVDNLILGFSNIKYAFFGIALCIVALIYSLKIKLALFNPMFALISIIVFSTIVIMYVLLRAKHYYGDNRKNLTINTMFNSIKTLFVSIVISLFGASTMLSFYAGNDYMLEMSLFRGVKLSQLLPLMIALVLSLIYFEGIIFGELNMSMRDKFFKLLNINIKVWHSIIVGTILLMVIIMLIRSGHESGVQPASMELLLRNILENVMPARPRTKAFLIAYPSIIIIILFAKNKLYRYSYPVLSIMLAIAPANIMNTFSHIRTPLYLSFMRVGMEFISSVLVTLIYILIFKVFIKLIDKIKLMSKNTQLDI